MIHDSWSDPWAVLAFSLVCAFVVCVFVAIYFLLRGP